MAAQAHAHTYGEVRGDFGASFFFSLKGNEQNVSSSVNIHSHVLLPVSIYNTADKFSKKQNLNCFIPFTVLEVDPFFISGKTLRITYRIINVC